MGLTAVEWVDKAFALWDGKNNIDPKKAIEYLTESIRSDPTYTYAYALRGSVYFELKQFDNAISDYDQAIHYKANYRAIYNNRGVSYLLLNKLENGCADLKQACKLGLCDVYEVARKEKKCK
jgi:Flp pilus assembly protein TadD